MRGNVNIRKHTNPGCASTQEIAPRGHLHGTRSRRQRPASHRRPGTPQVHGTELFRLPTRVPNRELYHRDPLPGDTRPPADRMERPGSSHRQIPGRNRHRLPGGVSRLHFRKESGHGEHFHGHILFPRKKQNPPAAGVLVTQAARGAPFYSPPSSPATLVPWVFSPAEPGQKKWQN